MSIPITCSGCGFAFQVPDGTDLASVSCTFCGAAIAPRARRLPDPEPEPEPPPSAPAPRPRRRQPAPAAPPPRANRPRPAPPPPTPPADEDESYRMAGTNEDDYEPYPVFTKAPTRPCPECGKPLECKATACVNCGLDLSSGQKVVRTFEPINKEWEAGWPYPMRFKAFIVCQIVTAVTALIGLVRGELGTSFFAWIVLTALLAFVLGTYNRIKLTRTAKGKVQLTKTWRICFLERPAETIRWREHEGIVTGRSHEVSAMDWMMFLVLLPFFILPAIVWWWFIINPDKFHAALTKDRGFPETMLYQGLKQAQAEEIADVVSNATGLPWSRG